MLENDYNWLDKIKKEKLAKIDELYSKIKPIQAEIESLEEELESVDEASGVIAQSLWDLESERQQPRVLSFMLAGIMAAVMASRWKSTISMALSPSMPTSLA